MIRNLYRRKTQRRTRPTGLFHVITRLDTIHTQTMREARGETTRRGGGEPQSGDGSIAWCAQLDSNQRPSAPDRIKNAEFGSVVKRIVMKPVDTSALVQFVHNETHCIREGAAANPQ